MKEFGFALVDYTKVLNVSCQHHASCYALLPRNKTWRRSGAIRLLTDCGPLLCNATGYP